MGWWRAGPNGESLVMEETGMVWGDEPADIMSEALRTIFREFEENYEREPTIEELISGLKFSAYGIYEFGWKNENFNPFSKEKK